jgi:hypothetical protein
MGDQMVKHVPVVGYSVFDDHNNPIPLLIRISEDVRSKYFFSASSQYIAYDFCDDLNKKTDIFNARVVELVPAQASESIVAYSITVGNFQKNFPKVATLIVRPGREKNVEYLFNCQGIYPHVIALTFLEISK